MTVTKTLNDADISFTQENILSNGFNGTRYIFESLKDAKQAQKATGYEFTAYFKRWAITLF